MVSPHSVFKGVPGGPVHQEVESFADEADATVSVQANAWFDQRVMLEWVENLWKYSVHESAML